jgi:uncharacterized protein (DUF2267 family)
MRYHELRERLAERTGLPEDDAERLFRATLTTLAERIGEDEADQLASELPAEFREDLLRGDPERFPVEEFLRRVRRRSAPDTEETEARVRAVLRVLAAATSEGELADVRGRLPAAFDRLFERG